MGDPNENPTPENPAPPPPPPAPENPAPETPKPVAPPEDPRAALREARDRRLKLIRGGGTPAMVKVYAGNGAMRALLRHPNGTGFRADINEAVEWPQDGFTARRIADGSIRTDGAGSTEVGPLDMSKNPREHAAAMRQAARPAKEA